MNDKEILTRFNTGRQPALDTLGAEVVEVDAAQGMVRLRCTATRAHCHSIEGSAKGGIVQGGFVTGWLDTAMAHACVARSKFTLAVPSLEIKVSFFEAMGPGIVYAEGRVMRWGGSVGFLDGDLKDEKGRLIVHATSTIKIVRPKVTKSV